MTEAEIIEMAKQSGCTEDIVAVTCHIYGFRTTELIDFARLIEKQVREECAALFEEPYKTYEYKWVVDAIRNSGGEI